MRLLVSFGTIRTFVHFITFIVVIVNKICGIHMIVMQFGGMLPFVVILLIYLCAFAGFAEVAVVPAAGQCSVEE